MTGSLRLRLLRQRDLPFADQVRALAGWNQNLADWERFLAVEPEGCFLAEWDGVPAGTATTTVYGPALAWIGMLLVHPRFRRRGVGRALLKQCIEHLRQRGIQCIKLDATPPGRKMYGEFGFKDEWTLTRWERAGRRPRTVTDSEGIRNWCDTDAGAVESLDTTAFGVSRRRILETLASQCRSGLVIESRTSRVTGYGLVRDGSIAHHLGPVVATTPDIALRLVELLSERGEGEKIIWDVPDKNTAAVAWAGCNGFVEQRTLTRMYLGGNTTPGDLHSQFAIAGPEIG